LGLLQYFAGFFPNEEKLKIKFAASIEIDNFW